MRKYRGVLIPAVIIAAVVALTVAGSLQARNGNPQRPVPADEATPVEEGVMTERQREHGKLFRSKSTRPVKIKDRLREQGNEKGEIEIWAPIEEYTIYPARPLPAYLHDLTCRADAVVAGKVVSKSSNLTADGAFLFTDYQVTVEEVVKDNAAAPIAAGGSIIVGREGGAVAMKGRVIRAISPDAPPLELNGSYLFYLKSIPATGAYRPVANPYLEDTFRIRGGKARPLSRRRPPPSGWHADADADAASFMNEARSVPHTPCSKKGTQ